ncbi:hypothetical protein [Rubrobacter calidifluminis]|uniref:hypothetical protein n=1 Tax=Rubrobacter calidifluminis TaxID=1392640 RepID=UPI002361414F|nr:hypothetical protein [Rubrobacter calidifluminis]
MSDEPITKIPPWGARRVQPNTSESAPATAEPTMFEGITRSGSAAAKGIAPSVMKEVPMIQLACPLLRSARVKSPGRRRVASASPSGGVIPAAITAAIGPNAPPASPAMAKA